MLTPQNRVNSNALSISDRKKLIQETYEGTSYFVDIFKKDQVKFQCQTFAQQLRQEVSRLLLKKKIIDNAIPLEDLHTYVSDEMRAYGFEDGVNKISTFFYDTDAQFNEAYSQFIQFIRKEIIKEAFFFQATPTIRIHCPNAINSHHYPRYHSDISYGHPPEEINVWIPLTYPQGEQCHGFRLMSVDQSQELLKEFDYDFSDFIQHSIHDKKFSDRCQMLAPQAEVDFGEVLIFDSRCIHSGEALKFHTRASIDIRVLPLSQFEKMTVQYQGLGRRKILFVPGQCYHEKHSDLF